MSSTSQKISHSYHSKKYKEAFHLFTVLDFIKYNEVTIVLMLRAELNATYCASIIDFVESVASNVNIVI